MPLTIAPNLIEQTDFSKGVATVPDDAALPMEVLTDALNLLPDEAGSGALFTREGISEILASIATSGYYVKHLFKYRRSDTAYLIAVVTNGGSSANNVKLYEINLSTLVATRIDTAGVTWSNSTAD